jgi:ABC-type hemin transport system ATPase subunit
VTHDLARAAALADRALVLVSGRVAFASRVAPASAGELEHAYRSALEAA